MKGIMTHPFTDDELNTLLECAHAALQDAETFDFLADGMDVPDADMCALRDKLYAFQNKRITEEG
jgi:hypothetical protein